MAIYQHVKNNQPGRSVFDLSYEKKFTCDMGQLIPVMCDEVVPGDIFKVGNQSIVRFQPLVAPVLHEINQYVHYFFVPYRLLWEDWEDFITGGMDGGDTSVIPEWDPTSTAKGTLWDYMGFPTGIEPTGHYPIDMPRRAYNLVYNEYYRDETLQAEVALDNETILNRSWEKDYFTSSLPWQQRGTAPALPISGITSALWSVQPSLNWGSNVGDTSLVNMQYGNDTISPTENNVPVAGTKTVLEKGKVTLSGINANTVDLSTASTFDIADLRLAFQVQKWLELNARAGARYTEFLKAHFGASPRDERLQRPEYFGGTKNPIIISEVLQTSSTDATTPQGNLAGHGIGISNSYAGDYNVKEFGLIIGIMSVMPRSAYSQGVNRQWLRKTKYDFYFPEFANLSEQAILNVEICAKADATHNSTIFGYQGRFDEMRTKQNMICADMRDTFDYWHLSRQFDTASPPSLNETFIKCVPRKDIFAVPSEPGLIVSFANIVKAFRPMPIQAEPGLIDHTY